LLELRCNYLFRVTWCIKHQSCQSNS